MRHEWVWFKRDLRWEDHAALANAARLGPVRCIYVVEPSTWQQPDTALQHFAFVHESLKELDAALQSLGGCLEVHIGEMTDVLDRLWREAPFDRLHSHEETGNGHTYSRDLKVHAWCKAQGVSWHEYPQFGVVRRLKDRDHWQAAYEAHMAAPRADPGPISFARSPRSRHGGEPHTGVDCMLSLPHPAHWTHDPPRRQRGGRRQGLATLKSFLNQRSLGYRGGISSPLSAPQACSRLSPYLAWGCLSLREVVQDTRDQLAALPDQAKRHRDGLLAFSSRLYWHCHFIQKLETEPAIEWHNMHRGYDGLRESDFNPAHFEALKSASTGWPLVDACVVMLRETGWINFRMRAMLVSVAAYPLWLHWRPVGEWLATQFLDYEPGIHWSQLQMQSGTTGINTTRVYNPIKQAQDHDPHGRFVRTWLPAMRQVPDEWLFEPWRMPTSLQAQLGIQVGQDIPEPRVDLAQATRAAKDRLHARRREDAVRAGKAAVVHQHASRKNWRTSPKKAKTSPRRVKAEPAKPLSLGQDQLGFDF